MKSDSVTPQKTSTKSANKSVKRVKNVVFNDENNSAARILDFKEEEEGHVPTIN